MRQLDRRTVIEAVGATASIVGFSGLASSQEDEGDGDEPEYGDWFDGVDNYDETVDDIGEDEVEVTVGAGDRGLQFDPPAVRVSEGTTVVWEWTGRGGLHDVVHDPGAEADELEEGDDGDDETGDEDDGDDEPEFESDLVDEEGHTFEHEFEDEGTFLYVCTPHRNVGMRGAVVVEGDGDDS